jgi:hypothetical protein
MDTTEKTTERLIEACKEGGLEVSPEKLGTRRCLVTRMRGMFMT